MSNIFKELRMRRPLVKFVGICVPQSNLEVMSIAHKQTKLSGLVNAGAKMMTGCCKNNKSCYICSYRVKVFQYRLD